MPRLQPFVRRVLRRLADAESQEIDPWLRDDLRVAYRTVICAATGEAVLCSPQVLASYMVLGLHPDRVWPAIEARRAALLGSHGKEFAGGKLPPKKPPVSAVVRSQQTLWFEKTNGARAINSHAAMPSSGEPAISVPMAAPSIAAAYPNPEQSGSAKERPFFKREELQEFFETCPAELIPHPELRTVHGMWNAAGKPFGSEIRFFKAIKHYCKSAPNGGYKSESAVRSNVRRAEDRGLIEVACRDGRGNCHHIWIRERSEKDRGLYRRVTTHRLSVPLLLKWRHLKAASQPKVEPIRKPSQPAPPDPPPVKTAPVRQPAAEHRSTRSLGRDQRLALFNAYVALKRSGMTHDQALGEVVRQFKNRFSPDDVEFALKIVGHKTGQDVTAEQAQDSGKTPDIPKCMNCGSVLVQNRGPGPRLICADCPGNSS